MYFTALISLMLFFVDRLYILENLENSENFRKFRSEIEGNWTRTHNNLVRKQTLNHFAKLKSG